MNKNIDYGAPSELVEIKRQQLTVGDGVRFGIGFALAPLILAAIIASCVLAAGGFAALFTFLGI